MTVHGADAFFTVPQPSQQASLCPLSTRNFNFHVQKSPLPDSVPSQLTPLHFLTHSLLRFVATYHFQLIRLFMFSY